MPVKYAKTRKKNKRVSQQARTKPLPPGYQWKRVHNVMQIEEDGAVRMTCVLKGDSKGQALYIPREYTKSTHTRKVHGGWVNMPAPKTVGQFGDDFEAAFNFMSLYLLLGETE